LFLRYTPPLNRRRVLINHPTHPEGDTMTREIFKRMAPTILILFGICSTALAQSQSQSPDRLWQALDAERTAVDVSQLSGLTALPRAFRPFRLDRARLTNLLQRSRPALSATSTCNGVEMTLPKSTGDFWMRFCVRESSIMEPALAAQFPTIKSYEGQGMDDPSMTARLDWTEKGLHAIVLSPTETYVIDPLPLRRGDLSTYISYRATDSQRKPFQCEVRSDPAAARVTTVEDSALRIPVVSNGETLRTYRLAVAATGEYSQFHGGTVVNAFSAIFTTINRVNAIYKSELAIQFVLVNDETKLIFTNPATDPYSNNSASSLLDQNQENIDRLIGSTNYDIGHVFSTGGGGLASLAVVGINGRKARGETGSSSPTGDFFDVDYVAHEIGHQFGANHTFNGTTGNCAGGNRNIDTAFEPGSGSTIMAYAGICGDEDLQDHSDPVFHIASLFEIISFVNRQDVRGVPRLEPTGNQPPIVQAGFQFHIPKRTPFVLTASANDPNQDALSFSWEEVDLGREAPPNNDSQDVRPIFRSFKPDISPARFFPRLGVLLNGDDPKGEVLSSRDRTLNFRVTVRDNRSNGGGFGSGDMRVLIVSDHGPFVITEPGPTSVWTAGSTQNITWDVAGTSLAPINCNNVRISISLDGGKTFTVLRESTPNTGTATIVVPNTLTASARVKVEAVSNIFFNVSGGDFRIISTN
jgi:hypothetical protein